MSIRRQMALVLGENSSMRRMALRLTVALKVIVVQAVLPLIGLVAGIYLFGMAKRSYRYSGYYIEVEVQEVSEKHFEGTATIFGSREAARRGQGPVHRCARMGRTREEADRVAAASAESWADGPGKRA